MNQINAMFEEMRAMTAFTNEFAYDYWIGTRWPGVGSAGGGGSGARVGVSSTNGQTGNNTDEDDDGTIVGLLKTLFKNIFGGGNEEENEIYYDINTDEKDGITTGIIVYGDRI